MRKILFFMVFALNAKFSVFIIGCFVIASFFLGQIKGDMYIFAASGGVATVFGLFSVMRFTTIEKYLNQDQIVQSSTGLTGPPVTEEEAERIRRESRERARVRIKRELRSELFGIALTIVGTIIWAYGTYVPIFNLCRVFAIFL